MMKTLQAVSVEKKTQVFRMSWLHTYASLAFWVSVVVVFAFVCPLLAGRIPTPLDLTIVFGGLLFELVFAVLFTVKFPLRLNTEGLHGFNFWGVPCFMTWEEMASATPSRYGGLPWLVVRSNRTKNVMWLPLFLADKQGFREAVARFASPAHPIL